jgi:hypothetical protein
LLGDASIRLSLLVRLRDFALGSRVSPPTLALLPEFLEDALHGVSVELRDCADDAAELRHVGRERTLGRVVMIEERPVCAALG